MADKRMSIDDAVAFVQDGMTIGIGGWGSRRKPMAFVRGLVRRGVKDLTVVSYGGPDVGVLCATGQIKKLVYAFVSLDSIPLEPHFRKARQSGSIEVEEYDEGMFQLGLRAAAQRLPFLPTRAGLGSDVMRVNSSLKTVKSPYSDGEELVAMPALNLDVAFVHMHEADAVGNGRCASGSDAYFDRWMCLAAKRAFMSCEKVVSTKELVASGPIEQLLINRMMVAGVVEAPGGAHFTECLPAYERDEAFQKMYNKTGKDPEAWEAFAHGYLRVSEAEYQERRHQNAAHGSAPKSESKVHATAQQASPSATPSQSHSGHSTHATRADVCALAVAECFRGDGEIMASPMGVTPSLGARLAKATFEPELLLTDGNNLIVNKPLPLGVKPGADDVEGWMPFPFVFDTLWTGKRHVMMGCAQIDAHGNQNIANIGPWSKPDAMLLGVRGAPGNTINHATSYWVSNHSPKVFVQKVDMVSGVGTDCAAALPTSSKRFHHLRRVVSNLAVMDFAGPSGRMRLVSVHPGVTVAQVRDATGFELHVDGDDNDVPTTAVPTDEQVAVLRQLDPNGYASRELPTSEVKS